ncbi:MAG: hypothetical protein AABX89_04460 [Candidatus Thermoplasmatota archaeon]
MSLYLFRIAVRDEPGALARVTGYLADWKVNLSGFVVDPGGMQILTNDLAAAKQAFDEAGVMTIVTPVHELTVPHQPGALADISRTLSNAGIDIVSAFGIAHGDIGRLVILASDAERAGPILQSYASPPTNSARNMKI